MITDPNGLLVINPGEGENTDLGGLGVDFKVSGDATRESLAIVEHPMEPGRLVPPHVHESEDELSYVLEGTFGVRVGDRVATAGVGTYVFKPRGVPHTFWNAGSEPGRLLEVIWPAGFERFFESLGKLAQTAGSPEEFEARRAELAAGYNLEFVPDWADELKEQYGLKLLGEP
ncbi:cupin domain-containing protein [Streptomyces sp. B1I3]|uniref:cupin domain-containing protein n=1 Tax=Streptomyces sp. B1I3 TaxID=3042264 RepID=UPI00278AE195|nr:cupin domain-containing protein [Streptomyces sp. B1I3]MDQ0791771.1 quercetin dioxygenase-like cupin family protein [Streptomyces sp. B1I3]